MLGFIKRLSTEFRDPYTLKALYVSLVRSKLEYACCVWQPFDAVHINRIERIQEKFVKYALRWLGWDSSSVLPPYFSRCSLLNLGTWRFARVMYVFDILSGRVSSPHLLAEVGLHTYIHTYISSNWTSSNKLRSIRTIKCRHAELQRFRWSFRF
jgi:hypothetical protein